MKSFAMRPIAGLLLAAGLAVTACPAVAAATPFTPGSVVVYRVGDGVNRGSVNAPVFLDEFSPTGTLLQSVAMPTVDSGPHRSFTAYIFSSYEGLLARSADGRFLTLAGYDAAVGTPNAYAADASTINRVVAVVDATGHVDTTTALADVGPFRPSSAASTDGHALWFAGQGTGLRFAQLGDTSSTPVAPSQLFVNQSSIADGQLYASFPANIGTGTVPARLGTVGSGTPTTGGQTVTPLPGIPTTGTPFAFLMVDLSPVVAGVDTLYVAYEDAHALSKYSLVAGSWAANGSVGTSADDYRGVTGYVTDGGVQLFATRKGAELVSLLDGSGYNGALGGTPALLASAGANTFFRGVALAPVPEPQTGALMLAGLGLLGWLARRPRRCAPDGSGPAVPT